MASTRHVRNKRPLANLGLLGVALLSAGSFGCTEDPCEESIAAQVGLPVLGVQIGQSHASAEIADDELERSRGWRHRRCDREVLALLPDDPEAPAAPLPVFGCALSSALDVALVRDDVVIDLASLDPCPEPCTACPLVGEDIPVHGVFEAPSGTLNVSIGDPVTWDGDPRAAGTHTASDASSAATSTEST